MIFSFREFLLYFAERLEIEVPMEDGQKEAELLIDDFLLQLKEGAAPGSLTLILPIGIFHLPPTEEQLKELCSSHFMGILTGGCTFALDEKNVLFLQAATTAGTSAHENWEWLQRLLFAARSWTKQLAPWKECVCVAEAEKEERDAKFNKA